MIQQVEMDGADHALQTLVQRVENGDEILLVRHGQTVARIVAEHMDSSGTPSDLTPEQQQRARTAMVKIRDLRDRLNLGPFDFEEFRRDRDEGRR